jgi:hypothetical protein
LVLTSVEICDVHYLHITLKDDRMSSRGSAKATCTFDVLSVTHEFTAADIVGSGAKHDRRESNYLVFNVECNLAVYFRLGQVLGRPVVLRLE